MKGVVQGSRLHAILNRIVEERHRQDERYGDLNHGLSVADWIALLAEEFGEASKDAVDFRFRQQSLVLLVDELIQVAAVAVQFIEKIHAEDLAEVRFSALERVRLDEALGFGQATSRAPLLLPSSCDEGEAKG